MSIADYSSITFEENSAVIFAYNYYGGAMHIILSAVTFKGNCQVIMKHIMVELCILIIIPISHLKETLQ